MPRVLHFQRRKNFSRSEVKPPLATSPSWGQGDDHGGGIREGGGSSGGGLVAEEEGSIIFAVSLGGPRR